MRFLIAFQLIAALCASDGWSLTVKKDSSPVKTDDAKTDVPPAQAKYKFDPWEAWNAFKEGSMIEFETETSGMKIRTRKTIDKKTANEITLKTETTIELDDWNSGVTSGTESVKKTSTAAEDKGLFCGGKSSKDYKDEGKWSEETVKVDDKEIKCKVYELAGKNCRGEDNPKVKMWYSTDVPGHIVKMENPQVNINMNLIKFDVKK